MSCHIYIAVTYMYLYIGTKFEHGCTSHSFTMAGVIHNPNATFQECNIRGTFDCLESAIRQSKDQFQYFKAKMQQFEQQGCNIKELFRDSKTPLLHCAVAAGLVEMVEKLVDLGASECSFYNLSS